MPRSPRMRASTLSTGNIQAPNSYFLGRPVAGSMRANSGGEKLNDSRTPAPKLRRRLVEETRVAYAAVRLRIRPCRRALRSSCARQPPAALGCPAARAARRRRRDRRARGSGRRRRGSGSPSGTLALSTSSVQRRRGPSLVRRPARALDLLGTLRGEPPPIERQLVLLDVAAVELERAIQRGAGHR